MPAAAAVAVEAPLAPRESCPRQRQDRPRSLQENRQRGVWVAEERQPLGTHSRTGLKPMFQRLLFLHA